MDRNLLAKELVKIAKTVMGAANTVSVDELMEYEDGNMDREKVIDLFQRLVKNGMAWTLQGSYGRMAMELIRQGLIKR